MHIFICMYCSLFLNEWVHVCMQGCLSVCRYLCIISMCVCICIGRRKHIHIYIEVNIELSSPPTLAIFFVPQYFHASSTTEDCRAIEIIPLWLQWNKVRQRGLGGRRSGEGQGGGTRWRIGDLRSWPSLISFPLKPQSYLTLPQNLIPCPHLSNSRSF